ncbi:hypothetical protein CPSG_00335 [Coccidioides posadasii str. Silveira]|uniref:Uncharacterized protein n=1 Tax=Coccidioides posadasii (strain RMSCC 757 / Silveira) TaxID=443226 RepID=E9CRF5_COCPS|nr:hypothetical protein CPSG_00335 [Coccidioides posadasii str. Silveira]
MPISPSKRNFGLGANSNPAPKRVPKSTEAPSQPTSNVFFSFIIKAKSVRTNGTPISPNFHHFHPLSTDRHAVNHRSHHVPNYTPPSSSLVEATPPPPALLPYHHVLISLFPNLSFPHRCSSSVVNHDFGSTSECKKPGPIARAPIPDATNRDSRGCRDKTKAGYRDEILRREERI